MRSRYYTEAGENQYLVIVDDLPDGLRIAVVKPGEPEPEEGQAADFALVQGPGTYSLLLGGRSVTAYLDPDAEENGLWHAALLRHRAEVRVQTEREYRLSKIAGPRHVAGGELVVKAPMPGLVRQVSVAAGDTVTKGQRLIVLEAMKMENDITAPRDGAIKTVSVKSGDTVENGRPLVTLE